MRDTPAATRAPRISRRSDASPTPIPVVPGSSACDGSSTAVARSMQNAIAFWTAADRFASGRTSGRGGPPPRSRRRCRTRRAPREVLGRAGSRGSSPKPRRRSARQAETKPLPTAGDSPRSISTITRSQRARRRSVAWRSSGRSASQPSSRRRRTNEFPASTARRSRTVRPRGSIPRSCGSASAGTGRARAPGAPSAARCPSPGGAGDRAERRSARPGSRGRGASRGSRAAPGTPGRESPRGARLQLAAHRRRHRVGDDGSERGGRPLAPIRARLPRASAASARGGPDGPPPDGTAGDPAEASPAGRPAVRRTIRPWPGGGRPDGTADDPAEVARRPVVAAGPDDPADGPAGDRSSRRNGGRFRPRPGRPVVRGGTADDPGAGRQVGRPAERRTIRPWPGRPVVPTERRAIRPRSAGRSSAADGGRSGRGPAGRSSPAERRTIRPRTGGRSSRRNGGRSRPRSGGRSLHGGDGGRSGRGPEGGRRRRNGGRSGARPARPVVRAGRRDDPGVAPEVCRHGHQARPLGARCRTVVGPEWRPGAGPGRRASCGPSRRPGREPPRGFIGREDNPSRDERLPIRSAPHRRPPRLDPRRRGEHRSKPSTSPRPTAPTPSTSTSGSPPTGRSSSRPSRRSSSATDAFRSRLSTSPISSASRS